MTTVQMEAVEMMLRAQVVAGAMLLAVAAGPAQADRPTRLILATVAETAAADAAAPDQPDGGWFGAILQPFYAAGTWITGWFASQEKAVASELGSFATSIQQDVSALEALVEDTGFTLDEIHLGIGLIPEISLTLGFDHQLGDAERAALLARVNAEGGAYGVIERALVDAMLAAADSNYAAGKIDGYRLEAIEVDVDLIPRVAMVIVPADETAVEASAKP